MFTQNPNTLLFCGNAVAEKAAVYLSRRLFAAPQTQMFTGGGGREGLFLSLIHVSSFDFLPFPSDLCPPRGTTAARRHHHRQSWMYFREVGRDSSGPVLCEIPCARFQIVPRVGVCLFIIQTTPRVRIIDHDNEKKTLNLPKQMLSCPNPVVCFIIFTDTSIPICISISLSFFSFHLFFSVMFLDK